MKNIFFTYKWIFGFLLIFSNLFNAQEGTKQVSPTATNLSGLLYHPANGYGSYIGASEDNNIKFVISDFNSERFYFGFSWTTYAAAAGDTTVLNYLTQTQPFFYRILDSNGLVVAGPTLLSQSAGSAGQITSYEQAIAGPRVGSFNPAGYLPIQFVPTKNDTYVIQYWRGTSVSNSAISNSATIVVSPLFDFTVASTTGNSTSFKPGRVFATKWGLVTTTRNTSGQYSTGIASVGSPSFFVYTDTNNVLKLEFPNFQPLGYNIGVNNYGVADTNNFAVDRRSVNNGASAPILPGGFHVFLNEPDPLVFSYGSVEGPPPSFAASIITPVGACNTAPYNINFKTEEYGDYRIIIKGSGNADRILYFYNLNAGNYSMEWDGKDGAGLLFPTANILTFELTAFADRFNVPIFDVERNAGGLKVKTIAPAGMQVSNLFWDDSFLTAFNPTDQNGNATVPEATANNSTIGTISPAHIWTDGTGANYYTYFGNARTINTWGYLYFQTITGTSSLLCADLSITKTVDVQNPAIGSEVIFTLTASNNVAGSTATSVVVNDLLPSGFTYVSSTPPSGTNFTYPNWNIGNLVTGTNRTIGIRAKVEASTNYTNVATIKTVNFETNYNNNTAYVKVTPPVATTEITVTNICPTSDIDIPSPNGLQLNNIHYGIVPAGSSLVWFNNATHTGSPLSDTFVRTSGSYYAFYYDSVANCYSPASTKVNVLIQNCKCRKSPTGGQPESFTKVGISTQASKTANWPENISNGFIAMESTNKGFVITRTTTASIANPIKGMLIYDTASNCFSLFNGTSWHCIAQTCND